MSGNTYINLFQEDNEDAWMSWSGPYTQLLREKQSLPKDHPDDPPPLLVRDRPHIDPTSAWVESTPELQVTISDTPAREQIVPSSFGKIPYEIHTMILRTMDIRTLRRLATLSSETKIIVDSLQEYRLLVKHAGAVLGALGHMKLAHLFTLEELFNTLTSSVCAACGLTGAFVFMLTCERVCLNCLETDARFWVMDGFSARKAYFLKVAELKELRALYAVKQPNRKSPRRGQKLFCQRDAAALALKCRGEAEFRRATYQDGNRGPRLVVWEQEELFPLELPGYVNDIWGAQFMQMQCIRMDGAEPRVERIAWCEGCSTPFHVNFWTQGKGHIHGGRWSYDMPKMIARPHQWTRNDAPVGMRPNAFRERTMAELAKHLKDCRGVPLVYKLLAQED